MRCDLIGYTKRRKDEVGRSQWLEVHEKGKKQVQLIITNGLMEGHKVNVLIDLGATKNLLFRSVTMKLCLMLMKDVNEEIELSIGKLK